MLSGKWRSENSIYNPPVLEVRKVPVQTNSFSTYSTGGVDIKISKSEQRAIYVRMAFAIGRIARVYDPSVIFCDSSELRRLELTQMPLQSLPEIAKWEAGWLSLLAYAISDLPPPKGEAKI